MPCFMTQSLWFAKRIGVWAYIGAYMKMNKFVFINPAEPWADSCRNTVHPCVRPSIQGPLLLPAIIFNPSIDKKLPAQESVCWNYFSIPKFQWCNR